jgi:hypothetical protein
VVRPDCSTVVIPVSSMVDRRWVRQVTARLRDLPGVEAVVVEIGYLMVSGRVDPVDVKAVVDGVGARDGREG